MQNQNLAVKSKSTSSGQICVQNAAKASNSSESQALPKDQILAHSSRASSSQNRSQILNANKARINSENPTQSPKNRANLISLNAAKGSCFTSGANLQQTAPSAADQDALLAEFKEFLSAHLPSNPSFHPCFDEALSYTLKSGGKHFRAMLVAGVVAAVRPERKESAFHVALAFETMHSYSLICLRWTTRICAADSLVCTSNLTK